MTNYYVPLFLLFIGVYLIQIGIFSKRYTEKLAPYFWNGKINWDPNVDRLKLLLSLAFLITPGTLMKSFIKFNSNNAIFNYSVFLIIISLILFLIWFDIKKIAPFTLAKKIIKGKTEDLNIKLNELFKKFEGLSSEVSHIEKTTINIQKKAFLTKSDIEDLKNSFDSFKKSSEQFDNDIKKEISIIKKNLEPKKRNSITIERRKEAIKKKFEIFKKELEVFSNFDSENNLILFNSYDIYEVTSYQILLVFFQDYYNIPKKNTREIIYRLFNDYFSISAKNGLNSGNWDYFKNNHLSDVQNFTLYSDLILNHNKFHSDSE
ncbi:hypothetical protein [Tenacibaculum singaporense]|uniref:Uncharacterized protein n=1 Tax=Tenacibaculum singaporense TaxID=2358479 RepID=A0A3S8R9Z6_9FLAO|nr:hypothetical protein [Tenacibaculum singaporense]AZJ36602.1 hypothetical protein D6T69_14110 [Tenacibaculum singaporense]